MFGCTPLHYACHNDHAQAAQLLLEAGADPSIANYNGHLPQDVTKDKEIKDLIENFGLKGGSSTKAAKDHE
jgi:ankyrin repeat protein